MFLALALAVTRDELDRRRARRRARRLDAGVSGPATDWREPTPAVAALARALLDALMETIQEYKDGQPMDTFGDRLRERADAIYAALVEPRGEAGEADWREAVTRWELGMELLFRGARAA